MKLSDLSVFASVHNVNEIAELEKRLAELQAVTEQSDNESQDTGSSSASFDDFFAPARPREGKRTPRVTWNNDPRDNVQGFRVGDFYYDSSWDDAHLERQLIPYPQCPKAAGEEITPEEEQRFEDEHNLWIRGKLALERCVWHYRLKRD